MAPTRSTVVADASVIVKWFLNENFSKESLLLRRAQVSLDRRIAVPSVARYEILNALKYSGKFGSDELIRISDDLEAYQFLEMNLDGDLSRKAVNIATKYGVTIYDSFYLAIGETRNLEVYTADDRLLEKVQELTFVHHIRDYS